MTEINDKINRCPKCGYAGQDKISATYHSNEKSDSITLPGQCECPKGEHLHLMCKRCGYNWIKDPINKDADSDGS